MIAALRRRAGFIAICAALAASTAALAAEKPLSLHPDNPRYFLFRGKPTVLVGSTEHYGAVINRDFDYVRYLDALVASGLNVTRIFSGQYRERPGKFGILPSFGREFEIVENTLAPHVNAYVGPWARVPGTRAADGGGKFDLTQWNPEYFHRLTDFVAQASRRGIMVEISLFSPYYTNAVGNHLWDISPWNAANNVNAVGNIDGRDALTLTDPGIVASQEALVRKITSELRGFDNVYYAICNEPFLAGVPIDWQAHMARVIREADRAAGGDHLILQEFSDPASPALAAIVDPVYLKGSLDNGIDKRLPEISIAGFHNARADVVALSASLGIPVGQNESIAIYGDAGNRISAWRMLLAGGAFHHGTDYSFVRGHEDGSFVVPPGGAGSGGPALRRQLGYLLRFMEQLDFIQMKPASELFRGGLPENAFAYGLADPGKTYVAHFSHEQAGAATGEAKKIDIGEHRIALSLKLPSGHYLARWIDPRTGMDAKLETIRGGTAKIASPTYPEDIVLRIDRLD